MAPEPLNIADLKTGTTAALFEGGPRAGVGISFFFLRTRPGAFVELHVHPYPETFILIEGAGRWTIDGDAVELEGEQTISVPADTPHGFRNIGDVPLLLISVHESPELIQTFLGRDPQ